MNKTTLTASVLVIGVTIGAVTQWQRYLIDLKRRFPNLDYRTIRRAYRQFLKNAAEGKYGPMQDFPDEQMDRLFLDIVREQTASK